MSGWHDTRHTDSNRSLLTVTWDRRTGAWRQMMGGTMRTGCGPRRWLWLQKLARCPACGPCKKNLGEKRVHCHLGHLSLCDLHLPSCHRRPAPTFPFLPALLHSICMPCISSFISQLRLHTSFASVHFPHWRSCTVHTVTGTPPCS